MRPKKNPVDKIKKKYRARINKMILKDSSFSAILDEIKTSPNNQFSGIERKESKKFDPTFIIEIERHLDSLEKIVKSPREFIKELYEVVPVEIAKKTGTKAIQHLSQHSELVKEIKSDGEVIPDKILGTFVEPDIAIYENRFVMTLIRKMSLFLEIRYRYIQDHGDTFNSDLLTAKTTMTIEGAKFECETKLKLVVPSDDEGNRAVNDDVLKRINSVRSRVNFLLNSPFMKTLKHAIPVTGKIQMTNLMKGNRDYRSAYELWIFIGKYDALGVSYSIKEKKNDFEKDYLNAVYNLILSSYLSLNSDKARMSSKKCRRFKITPHFVTPIIDKDFSNERFLESIGGKGIGLRILTDEQIVAMNLKKEKREKAKAKKLEKIAREKAILAEKKRKEIEKEKARILRAKEAEKEAIRQKRLKEIAKKKAIAEEEKQLLREKARIKAEKEAAAKALAEEAAKLKATRAKIKQEAVGEKKKQ